MLIDRAADTVVGRVTFPFTNYLFNRTGIYRRYRQLMKTDNASQEALQAIQLSKLRELIAYAAEWVPYYTRLFGEAGFRPEDVKRLEDIECIPPLERDQIVKYRSELVDKRYRESIPAADRADLGPGQPKPFARFSRHKLVQNSSSGSTGFPVVFYEDGTTPAWSWAHELRLKSWYGLKPGTRDVRFLGVSADYRPDSAKVQMRKHLWHQLIVPGIDLNETVYEIILGKIREYRPQMLQGYTTSLTGLAEHIQRTSADLADVRPTLILAWAGPLYAHEEYLLKQVFDCATSNIYGSREVGHVAGVCPAGSMHINQENYYVEATADGELLVTPLFKSPMPFIRYRIGDMGEIVDANCECGRNHRVIGDLLGRKAEIYITGEGHMISPNYWCRLFMGSGPNRTVDQFQVVYHEDDSVTLRIVPRDNYTGQMERHIDQAVRRSFGPGAAFRFEYLDHIDPLPSGKYQMVVYEADLRGR